MVLDIFDRENDKLLFKNTYEQEGQIKRVEIERFHSNAPDKLYFVHVEIKDIDNLPDQEERIALKKATEPKRQADSDMESSTSEQEEDEIETRRRKTIENAVTRELKRVKK